MTTTNQYIGSFLFIEGLASILYSKDQQPISHIGRLIRMGIGYYIYKH